MSMAGGQQSGAMSIVTIFLLFSGQKPRTHIAYYQKPNIAFEASSSRWARSRLLIFSLKLKIAPTTNLLSLPLIFRIRWKSASEKCGQGWIRVEGGRIQQRREYIDSLVCKGIKACLTFWLPGHIARQSFNGDIATINYDGKQGRVRAQMPLGFEGQNWSRLALSELARIEKYWRAFGTEKHEIKLTSPQCETSSTLKRLVVANLSDYRPCESVNVSRKSCESYWNFIHLWNRMLEHLLCFHREDSRASIRNFTTQIFYCRLNIHQVWSVESCN